MTKNEFLDGLRLALMDELPSHEIEENLYFYQNYINGKLSDTTEEDILNELGEPRLIAKTIIETYKISKGSIYQSNKKNDEYQNTYTKDGDRYEEDYTKDKDASKRSKGYQINLHNPTFLQKVLLFVIVAFISILVIIIGGFILRLFFTIGIPILVIYFGVKLVKNSINKK